VGVWWLYNGRDYGLLYVAVPLTMLMSRWGVLWALVTHLARRGEFVLLWQMLPARTAGPVGCIMLGIGMCLVAFLALFGEGWRSYGGQPIISLAKSATFFPVVAAAVCYLSAPITQQGSGPEMTRTEGLCLTIAIGICVVGLLALPFLQWGHMPLHRGLFVVSMVYGVWYTYWLYKRY
jgi:hypothetical protein